MSKKLLATLGVAVCVAVLAWAGTTLFTGKAVASDPLLLPPGLLPAPTVSYAQWQYDVQFSPSELTAADLNARGSNGWELAAVYLTPNPFSSSGSSWYNYVFKRTPR